MTTKKNTNPTPEVDVADTAVTAPLGRFAQIEADATAGYEPSEPYVLDEFDPPIIITEPVESHRVLALAVLYTKGAGSIEPAEFEPLLRAVCGDAYDRVWSELLRNKHFRVTKAFMADIQQHFAAVNAAPAADLPADQ